MAKQRRRARIMFGRRSEPGTRPGALTVDPTAQKSVLRMVAYGPDGSVEEQFDDPQRLIEYTRTWPVTWINVDGLGDARTLAAIGEMFGIHALALEDVVNTRQRSKVEEYDDQLFVVVRMVDRALHLTNEQVSLVLGQGYVITFQEHSGDCLEPVRKRIRLGKGRIRKVGADYLAYAIVDAVIDHYFPVLEGYGDAIDAIEQEIFAKPTTATIGSVYAIKHDLLALRRAIWPLREALTTLGRDETPLVTEETQVYLRDAHDHAVQVIEVVESYRELASGLMDAYMSSVSNRMNEVMRVLTIFAAVFIPLTFIAGVYGMNFNADASPWNMPELNWYWGYPAAIGAMLLAAAGLLAYFWRKGWLGGWLSMDRAERQAPQRDLRPLGEER